MNTDKFKNDLMVGETSSIEFKRCGNEIEHDVFESICAFLNRFGGDVYLGKSGCFPSSKSQTVNYAEFWYNFPLLTD